MKEAKWSHQWTPTLTDTKWLFTSYEVYSWTKPSISEWQSKTSLWIARWERIRKGWGLKILLGLVTSGHFGFLCVFVWKWESKRGGDFLCHFPLGQIYYGLKIYNSGFNSTHTCRVFKWLKRLMCLLQCLHTIPPSKYCLSPPSKRGNKNTCNE